MDIMDRARELIGESKKKDIILKGEKVIVNNAQRSKDKFGNMEILNEQPKTLLDTVKVDNQKTKVVDGEQVLVENLGETGNAIPKTETVTLPTETKTKRGDAFKNNTIEIWNNDGKYGISINKQLHEIPQAIYDLFLRMVENHRQILTELENEIHNNKKLKGALVQ